MNIIDRRNAQNSHRRDKKKQYDDLMQLSVQTQEWVPLLQEGMVTYGDGSPWFYIMRGALRRFYDGLSEDYEGSINIGHTDMATFPDRIVGRWTKENLRLVDIEDNRQRLETNLPLNRQHPLVQALEQAEFDMGTSVEMSTVINEELTENRELNPFGVPVVEDLFIYDYALVGNAGDVNSMGMHLKGGSELQMNKLTELLNKEGGNNLADINKLLDDALTEAEVEPSEETEETVEEEVNLEAEESEEKVDLEAEETEEEETTELSEETEEPDETEETFLNVMNRLADEIKVLRAENQALKEQLAAKEKAEAAFVEKYKNLTVSLSATPKAVTEPKKVYTDGIGE